MYYHLFQHPAFIIFLSTIGMIFTRRSLPAFSLLALSAPLLSAMIVYAMPQYAHIDVGSVSLVYLGTWLNKMIAMGFLIILFIANLNAISYKRYFEIILGNIYAALTITSLMAGEFLSLFISLELMAVISAVIIFIGGRKSSLRAAKKYFITHLISGNMILIGVIHIFIINNSFDLVELGDFLDNERYSQFIIGVMLIGMLINIAAFPFTGWMVNYYSCASSSGFIYLISYTTKLSLILLAKIFAGCTILKYVAIIMVIHAAINALFEKEMMQLICYFSILSMAFSLLAISAGEAQMLEAIIYYIFVSIITFALLSLVCTALMEEHSSSIFGNNSMVLTCGLLALLPSLLALPGNLIFNIKILIGNYFHENIFIYAVIMLISFAMAAAFPWKEFLWQRHSIPNGDVKLLKKIAIIFLSIITLIIGFMGSQIFGISSVTISNFDIIKHIILLASAILFAVLFRHKRFVTKPIAIVELIGDIMFYFHQNHDHKDDENNNEDMMTLENIEAQYNRSAKSFHDQRAAIMAVFVILAGLLFLSLFIFAA